MNNENVFLIDGILVLFHWSVYACEWLFFSRVEQGGNCYNAKTQRVYNIIKEKHL